MARGFFEALTDRPLVLEPVPPSARSSPNRSAAHVEDLLRLLAEEPRIDAVDVPELVDENHDGRPYYRSGDIRRFAREVHERSGREVLLNKVVAHLPNVGALERWAEETTAQGLRHVVLVGGTSRYIPYPGPSVTEANRVLRPVVEAAGGSVGNIAIPQRTGEAHRMLLKTRSGARFFTTQIVFDSESVLRMLGEYDRLCRQASRPPAPVLLSFAPIADEGDAEFVRWLGADIPEVAERSILNGDESEAGKRSTTRAIEVWRTVTTESRARGIEVPLGVNVEQISVRHLATAGDMVRRFAREIDAGEPG